MNIAVIIVAGGRGSRMGSELPKQFMLLEGRPVLMHTIQRFAESLPGAQLIVVLPADQFESWRALCRQYRFDLPHEICAGGETRFASVYNGLAHVGAVDYVAVHDGARPLVSRATIMRAVECAVSHGSGVPVVEPCDSFRLVEMSSDRRPEQRPIEVRSVLDCETQGDDQSRNEEFHGPQEFSEMRSRILDRSLLRAVQTPQVFQTRLLREAYAQPYRVEFTDDASVVEAAGYAIALCKGERRNLKITTPDDMVLAEALLKVHQNEGR